MSIRRGTSETKAYIITGPTSGVGRETALVMAREGMLVLVGRNLNKLRDTQKAVEKEGGQAVPIVCDISDLRSVHRAAAEILSLDLKLVGLLNNAGIQNPSVTKTADGWDNTFVTNHIGPFALTEALLPHLENGCECSFRWFSHGRSRAQARGAGRFFAVAATSLLKQVCEANGRQVVRPSPGWMPMLHRSSAASLQRWCLRVRIPGCASTPLNRESCSPQACMAL